MRSIDEIFELLFTGIKTIPAKVDDCYYYDFIGTAICRSVDPIWGDFYGIDGHFVTAAGYAVTPNSGRRLPPYPSEDYFEWLDLSVALMLSESCEFTMLDIGSGYGRWSVNALALNRALNYDTSRCRIYAIEPNVSCIDDCQKHLQLNGFKSTDVKQIGEAIGGSVGSSATRLISTPEKYGINHACGGGDGKNLVALMESLNKIDFVTIDAQGAELKFIENYLHDLEDRALAIHISTHSTYIEKEIFNLLKSSKFKIKYYLPIRSSFPQSPYGEAILNDGIISLFNTGIIGPRSVHLHNKISSFFL